MQFFALVSVLFFPTVSVFYFLPGHSHMICDRVVGWNRRRIKSKNLFLPSEIADEFNKTKAVKAEVLRGTDFDFPFRVGWKDWLSKYFRKLPGGFTANYVFEFTRGVLTMRALCSTPDDQAIRVNLLKGNQSYDRTRQVILQDLFGVESIEEASMQRLCLERHSGVELKKSKLCSLARNIFQFQSVIITNTQMFRV